MYTKYNNIFMIKVLNLNKKVYLYILFKPNLVID